MGCKGSRVQISALRPVFSGSFPDTWVTDYSGDMGNTLAVKGFGGALDPTALIVEEAQVVVHEADEPDVVSDFSHANVLSREDLTEVDFAPSEAQAAALGHGDGHVMERVMQLRESRVRPG